MRPPLLSSQPYFPVPSLYWLERSYHRPEPPHVSPRGHWTHASSSITSQAASRTPRQTQSDICFTKLSGASWPHLSSDPVPGNFDWPAKSPGLRDGELADICLCPSLPSPPAQPPCLAQQAGSRQPSNEAGKLAPGSAGSYSTLSPQMAWKMLADPGSKCQEVDKRQPSHDWLLIKKECGVFTSDPRPSSFPSKNILLPLREALCSHPLLFLKGGHQNFNPNTAA